MPAGTGEGLNGWQRSGYGGPCPPIGSHRYSHKLYALEHTMQGHVIAQAELIGRHRRK